MAAIWHLELGFCTGWLAIHTLDGISTQEICFRPLRSNRLGLISKPTEEKFSKKRAEIKPAGDLATRPTSGSQDRATGIGEQKTGGGDGSSCNRWEPKDQEVAGLLAASGRLRDSTVVIGGRNLIFENSDG